jgi:23S rRNA pseudouridine2604 synthase
MSFRRTYDGAEPVRVNKWLAQAGVCSRREAEDLIAQGVVTINGETVSDPGRKIETGQTIEIRDAGRAQFSVVLNKPIGFVSAQPEKGQVPAARLIVKANLVFSSHLGGRTDAIPSASTKLAPLGRLDQDSRGLLILSEDGVLAKAIIGPESKLDKEYEVRVDGALNDKRLALLRHGLSLDGRTLKPAKINVIGDQHLRFVLNEGRNRQIRRMCEAVDLRVVDLLRTRIGPLKLGALPEGKWRPLNAEERAALIEKS